METDDARKEAFSLAGDVTKQLITIAAGAVTVSATFAKEFARPNSKNLLGLGWVVLIISSFLGAVVLMAMAGQMNAAAKGSSSEPSIYAKNIRIFSIGQLLLFIVGLCLIAYSGYRG